jgi:hypothetical protein
MEVVFTFTQQINCCKKDILNEGDFYAKISPCHKPNEGV